MVTYECDKCNKSFNHKSDYNKHINRKIPCISNEFINMKNNKISELEQKIIELEKIMKDKDQIILEKDRIIQENIRVYEKNIEILKQLQIEKNKPNIITNYNNCNNTSYNNTITIYNFGKENISELTDKEKLSILNSGNYCLTQLIKLIHNNDRLPHYKNIAITNCRDNNGFVIENNKWIRKPLDEILDKEVISRMDDMQALIDQEKIKDQSINAHLVQKKIDNYLEDSDKFISDHKLDIKNTLYNNTKNNYKKTKKN